MPASIGWSDAAKQPSVWGQPLPRIPGTSSMRLDVRVDVGTALSVTWRADSKPLGVTPGAGGRVDLRPAVGAAELWADVVLAGGAKVSVGKAVSIVAATTADEKAYGDPRFERFMLWAQITDGDPATLQARGVPWEQWT